MSIEVVTLRTAEAVKTGDVVSGLAGLHLGGADYETSRFGTVTFTNVQPTKFMRWKSAEVLGRFDDYLKSVRVRMSDGTDLFWMDVDDEFKIKPVTDSDDWSVEYTLPSSLGNLDLWTKDNLQLVVYMTRKTGDNPIVQDVRALMNFPTWTGAVADSVKSVVDFVATIQPTMVEEITVSTSTSSFNFSSNEHNFKFTELIQVLVDGKHRSASLTDGKVVLSTPAPAGSTVTVAAKYLPNTTVRRVGEVRVLHQTPAWWIQDLVVGGGLNGKSSTLMVSGDEVKENRVELRMIINGIAHRQKDALAMRLALQEFFGPGLQIVFPSGRCASAQIDGLVEVIGQGSTGLPMASAVLKLVITEYVYSEKIRNARLYDDPNQAGNALVYSTLCIDLPDGVSVLSNFASLLTT
jgi:hypothetical protein